MSRTPLRRWLSIGLTVVVATAAAACGSDDDGSDDTTTVPATAAPTTTAAPASAAGPSAGTEAPAATTAAPGTTTAPTTAAAPTGDPYRLGVIIEQSGTFSALGIPELEAIELAVEHVNSTGGVGGRPLELEVKDSASDPATASAAAREFVDSGDVDVIVGPATGASCNAVNAIVVPEGIMQYCLSPIAGEINDLSFWALAPLAEYPDFVLPWFEHEGISKLAVVKTADATGDAAQRIVDDLVAKSGGSVEAAGSETFNSGATDVQTQLTKIRDQNPDVIFAGASGANMLPIVQAMNTLGMTQPVLATHGAAVHAVLDLLKDDLPAGGVVAGLYWVDVSLAEVPADVAYRAQLEEFVTGYEAEYGNAPGHVEGAAYDAVHQIAAAISDGAESGGDIAAHIEADDFVGVMGPYSYSDTSHQGVHVEIGMFEFGADGEFHLHWVQGQ